MIVFDLKCGAGHVFEAWFGSGADFDDQRARGLLACPICGDESVGKAVMAPAVAAKGNRQDRGGNVSHVAGVDAAHAKAALCRLAELQASMLENSEYVGDRFAEEARAIHHGESEARGIYGETTLKTAAELCEEGVSALPLPFPVRPRRGDA